MIKFNKKSAPVLKKTRAFSYEKLKIYVKILVLASNEFNQLEF